MGETVTKKKKHEGSVSVSRGCNKKGEQPFSTLPSKIVCLHESVEKTRGKETSPPFYSARSFERNKKISEKNFSCDSDAEASSARAS